MKNVIVCKKKIIFIFNFDKTILLRFNLPGGEDVGDEEIIFDAGNYDSPTFKIENGIITFESLVKDEYIKKTRCVSKKGISFQTLWGLFRKYAIADTPLSFTLREGILTALKEDLSHVEIHYDNGIKVVQKDIFSGVITEIEERKTNLNLSQDELEPFEPIGLRTVDLIALFNFDKAVKFSFSPGANFFVVEGLSAQIMKGVVSWCLYDELGTFNVLGG